MAAVLQVTVVDQLARALAAAPESPVARDDLFARLRARDERAVAVLCSAYGPMVRRIAWVILGDASLAEDIAQETMVAAWEGARRAREDTRLGAWLAGIAVNLSRAEARKRFRRVRREQAHEVSRETLPDQSHELRDELSRVSMALSRLPLADREVIALRYVRDLGVPETARLLGVPEGTVKSRTHAAIQRLRALLGVNAP